MHAAPGLLAVVGSVCLTLALVLAWCLAGVRSSSLVKRCFPGYSYLLKAHLDYLMMAGLLYVFFLLFEQLRLAPPPVVIAAMSLGSLTNPAGFLALALKPDLQQRPATPFGALMAASFAVTTVGYGGAAWCVARAVFPLTQELIGESSVPYLIGIVLSAGVFLLARLVGLDRDRAFYPTVMMVIAAYYVLFAAMSSSTTAILVESAAALAFIVAAIAGFRSSLWIVAVALAAHGVFDAVHGSLVQNPGVPAWWPAFCLAYDVGAAVGLAFILQSRARPGSGMSSLRREV